MPKMTEYQKERIESIVNDQKSMLPIKFIRQYSNTLFYIYYDNNAIELLQISKFGRITTPKFEVIYYNQ